ncbi:MAG: FG-GAP-like repeat-containing protein [Paenisporosarcina sp.]
MNEQIKVGPPELKDLAVANIFDNDVSIRLGNGDGTFTSTAPDVSVGNEPASIAVGDFNT